MKKLTSLLFFTGHFCADTQRAAAQKRRNEIPQKLVEPVLATRGWF